MWKRSTPPQTSATVVFSSCCFTRKKRMACAVMLGSVSVQALSTGCRQRWKLSSAANGEHAPQPPAARMPVQYCNWLTDRRIGFFNLFEWLGCFCVFFPGEFIQQQNRNKTFDAMHSDTNSAFYFSVFGFVRGHQPLCMSAYLDQVLSHWSGVHWRVDHTL